MTPEEIKLECLRLAVGHGLKPKEEVVLAAEMFYGFIYPEKVYKDNILPLTPKT